MHSFYAAIDSVLHAVLYIPVTTLWLPTCPSQSLRLSRPASNPFPPVTISLLNLFQKCIIYPPKSGVRLAYYFTQDYKQTNKKFYFPEETKGKQTAPTVGWINELKKQDVQHHFLCLGLHQSTVKNRDIKNNEGNEFAFLQ